MSTVPSTPTGNVSVHMLRDDMAQVPQYALPSGYRFRRYRDGDDATWTALHVAGEPFIQFTPDIFVREFGQNRDALYDRMYFVETDQGTPVATITAWWARDKYTDDERGLIHWVLVHPEHRRHGLTKPMMTHAMAHLVRDYPTAMLGTSTGRIWALKVYLDFGFHPHPVEPAVKPEVTAAWQAVQDHLHHPLLAAWLPRLVTPQDASARE